MYGKLNCLLDDDNNNILICLLFKWKALQLGLNNQTGIWKTVNAH